MKFSELYRGAKRHVGIILAGVGIAGALAFGPPAYVTTQDVLRGKEIEQEISHLEQTLSDKYDIDVTIWAIPPGGFERPQHPIRTSLKSHSPYMSLKALEGLEEAMSYYPKELLQKHLHRIEIVREYKESTEEIMRQGATPVANMSWSGGMSISAGRDELLRYHNAILGNIFESESFHHELAHQLTQDIPEEDWRAIHPDAVYNSATWRSLPSIPVGFYNRYCTHSVNEDIPGAVELLYDEDYNDIVNRDDILRKKANYLKEWYLKISDGAIDETYWDTVQHGRIPTWQSNSQ
jgi:hypothetical protein